MIDFNAKTFSFGFTHSIHHTPPRNNKELKIIDICNRKTKGNIDYLNIHTPAKSIKAFKASLKLRKLESSSTVPSLNSKSRIIHEDNKDNMISPICKERKNFWLGNENKENNKLFNIASYESLSKAKYDFSSRNYYPRKNTFDVEVKLNMENYFNNNHLPSTINLEESEISQSYFKMSHEVDNLGYQSSYQINHPKLTTKSGIFHSKQNSQSEFFKTPNSANVQKSTNTKCRNLPENLPPNDDSSGRNVPSPNNLHRKYSCVDDLNKEKRSMFVERQGDWICVRCKNLNFSFRVVCNRCKLGKNESQTFFEDHMRNLMNIVQYNEMIQTQANPSNFFASNVVNTNNTINNTPHVFTSNLFSINTPHYNNSLKCKTAGFLTKESIYMNK